MFILPVSATEKMSFQVNQERHDDEGRNSLVAFRERDGSADKMFLR